MVSPNTIIGRHFMSKSPLVVGGYPWQLAKRATRQHCRFGLRITESFGKARKNYKTVRFRRHDTYSLLYV
jgi:hypothetical protein